MSEHENDDKGRVSLDLKELRLSQDFDVSVGVKKVLLTVPVRRPDRQWFHVGAPQRFVDAPMKSAAKNERMHSQY